MSREAGAPTREQRAVDDAGSADVQRSGILIASHRRHFIVRQDDGEIVACVLKGRRMTLACGDRVQVAHVAGGAAVESVAPRTTLFYRSDAFNEKLIAANVDQVVGVVAPDLTIDEELVNRWMVAAEAEACRFVLAANKSDKADFDALLVRLAPYAALNYAVVPMSARR